MKATEMYYYVFYKYYKLFCNLNPKQWTPDMCAVLVLMNLDACVLFSIGFYYDILSHTRGNLTFLSLKVLIPFIIIVFVQWLAFWRDDNWKKYIYKFDKWPKDKDIRGTWVVIGISILLIANFFVALYLDPPAGGWK